MLVPKVLSSPTATFLLDPFIPRIVVVYLWFSLRKWRKQGVIERYHIHVERIGKLRYSFHLQVDTRKKETHRAIVDFVLGAFGLRSKRV
jgi:hypothetical protein